ncbi:bifunctional diguanylate cyclase/phosphodiesterase [Parafrankia sp. EUN1f]|uniref:putative bifunctional diguanylate cyclase/phosphodiesterase n=1 Tax=Parafrankia sp. EUN1f TaxID=102897 RepID=UPI0001C4575C|nr:diguanylate cyclase [Parafrankia sp. EUN1f]EFC82024.1 diguanylate cyclase/phosphodiesterase [Parafrankia sp. EUN1f]
MSHGEVTRGTAPEQDASYCGAAMFRRIVGACAVVAFVVLLAPFVLPSRGADLAVRLGGMAAMGFQGGCELWSTPRARGAERRWRLLLLTGWIGVAIGLMITSVRALSLGQNPLPPLSGTEPAYLAFIPSSIAAVLAFPTDPLRPEDEPADTRGTHWKIVTVLDALLLVGSLSLLGWVAVFGPLVRARAPAPAPLGVLLAFGLGCFLLLITVLLVAVFRRPRCKESFVLLGGGLGSITVLLHVSLYFIASGRPEPLQLVASNAVGTMMIGLACIVPPRPPTDRAVCPAAVGLGSAPGGLARWRACWAGWQAGQGPRWARLLLPYVPLAALGVLVAVQMATETHVRASELLGVLLLVLVVLIRQLLTLADNMRLLDRAEQSRRQLRHQALHDPLTGLANRVLFGDRLEHAVARPSRGRLALLFCDLDDFKTVNDTLGHPAGDELLRLAARRLVGCVPPSDTVARLGGDEFAVLLEDETADAEAVGRRVRAAVGAPCRLAGQPCAVQVSIGLAVAEPGSPISSESLLQQADLAMYAAKQRGKDSLVVYGPGLVAHGGSSTARRALHQVLRGDPAGGVLDVLYQPIVDLTHGHPVAYQASTRWRHPILGHLTGEQTVAVAAGAGLSHQLEQVILDRACHDIGRYRRRTGKNVAVYVGVSVARSTRDLPADIETALAASHLPVQALVLRLSETERLDEQAADSLRTCAARGLRLALNGIAGNHNSLLALDELPIGILMFDSSLGGRAAGSGGRADLLRRAVIAFAEDLGLMVIATGVQSRQQARSLARHGCRFALGRLFGPPAALPGAAGRPAA